MRLLAKVYGVDAMIIGYVAIERRVHAIVIMLGAATPVPLEDLKFENLPKPLRAKRRKQIRRAKSTDLLPDVTGVIQ